MPSALGACDGAAAAPAAGGGAKDILPLLHLVADAPAHCATDVHCPVCQDVAPLQDGCARIHLSSLLRAHQQHKSQVQLPWPSSSLLWPTIVDVVVVLADGCAGVATTLVSLCRQMEKFTKLTLPVLSRCIIVVLAMVPLLPLPLPPLIGGENDTHSTNTNSSPALSVQAVSWALKARVLLDRPLLASRAGSKNGKGDCGNDNGAKLDHAPDQDDPPLHPPSGGVMAMRIVGK